MADVLDEVASALPPSGRGATARTTSPTSPSRFFAAEVGARAGIPCPRDPGRGPRAGPPSASSSSSSPRGAAPSEIDATIHVERPGQKKILVGAGGAMLQARRTAARLRIEELVGRKVNLRLWVRVTPNWRKSAKQIEELGYGIAAAGAGTR